MLVLRSDMTIPIARVVATRYAAAEPPLRFCYFAHAYRSVRPQRGQAREILQAGLELVGAPGPDGTAEALSVLCAGLDAAGLENYRIGLGDASLYRRLLDRLAVPEPARGRRSCTSSSRATSSGSSARSRRTGTRSSCASRSCAAASRCSRGSRRPASCAPCTTCWRPRSRSG